MTQEQIDKAMDQALYEIDRQAHAVELHLVVGTYDDEGGTIPVDGDLDLFALVRAILNAVEKHSKP